MDKGKLSDKEEALLAEARRMAAARKGTPSAVPAPREAPRAPQAKAAATPAERLAQLMADERAATELRKRKMRRYGITISAAILAIFLFWVLRALLHR